MDFDSDRKRQLPLAPKLCDLLAGVASDLSGPPLFVEVSTPGKSGDRKL